MELKGKIKNNFIFRYKIMRNKNVYESHLHLKKIEKHKINFLSKKK